MSRAYDPNASDFLENAFESNPCAAVLMANLAQSPFYLCRSAQVENNFQSNIETPSESFALRWKSPF
jgi:hypothetical protein